MDFDDLLRNTLHLLRDYPDILGEYQRRFLYIMVDEYQDTNHIQYEIIKMLAAASRNLCVVGDDDQCIYQWRGADIRNILDFEKDFKEARVIKLEQNYRSCGNILSAAHSVIRNNKGRKEKKLWTEQELIVRPEVPGKTMMEAISDPEVAAGLPAKAGVSVVNMAQVIELCREERDNLRISDIYDLLLVRTGYLKSLEDQNTIEAE